ncbi:MAG TPA: PfkB family carbohydrate kinase [Bacteroidota bacterium]|nr:PfkB family carbohydrate kinase [Bacteroidota bacterium]
MNPLNLDIERCRYQALIGVGGIGSGMFFRLNGDATLGREESRSGYFLDRKDYCKLHIITHYVKALLGPDFHTVPVGRVGDDDIGARLIDEMADAGLDINYVERTKGSQTLFSFCFIYPDGSGGNMTTSDSACSKVDPAYVLGARAEFEHFAKRGIALAAPEVSLEARKELLDLATRHGFFRVASFTSEEMPHVLRCRILESVDLLAINLDEAAAAVGLPVAGNEAQTIIEAAVSEFSRKNPSIQLSVTMGKNGSCCWDGNGVIWMPVRKVHVESTAGAGDAFLAGLIAGVTAGLPLHRAQELATLAGGDSVQSPHTINKNLDRNSLRKLSNQSHVDISPEVQRLLEDPQ